MNTSDAIYTINTKKLAIVQDYETLNDTLVRLIQKAENDSGEMNKFIAANNAAVPHQRKYSACLYEINQCIEKIETPGCSIDTFYKKALGHIDELRKAVANYRKVYKTAGIRFSIALLLSAGIAAVFRAEPGLNPKDSV